jgi:hypothetical protein
VLRKIKRGRLWFIRCQCPIPSPPAEQDAVVAAYNKAKGVGVGHVNIPTPQGPAPTLRPIRQPFYDSSPLVKSAERPTLFHKSGILNGHGFYSMTYNEREVHWVGHQDDAAGFDTREEAEERAFELTLIAPWLISKLEVVKLKTRRLG